MNQPLSRLQATPLDLGISNLPRYALYTTLRMFAAMLASTIFTFIFSTLAAKYKKAEMLIIPTLDILQSVPVLGFLTFTVTFFLNVFPGYEAGAELAAIFAVFTAQAWNMAFSFYQSLRTVPSDLKEVSTQFKLNSWQKFWRMEVPFAIPGLVWNAMMSMSGSWFYIVAAEAISVGNTQISLPGIGSWLSLAIQNKDLTRVGWAVLTMGVVILLYDQIIFRPIVAWADKFNVGQIASQLRPKSWVYDVFKRAKITAFIAVYINKIKHQFLCIPWPEAEARTHSHTQPSRWIQYLNLLWNFCIFSIICITTIFLMYYLSRYISLEELLYAVHLAVYTAVRVTILVAIATIVWVPIGVWVGLRPSYVAWVQPTAQFLAAFPANILFPIAVVLIIKFNLNPNIWLSSLMILGTQWYIFFNVIAGVSVYPNDLKEVAYIYNIKSWLWWKKVMLPGIFPYYITGALTATGGAWNASIVAEVASWGDTKLEAAGLGSYIANATAAGDMNKVTLGVAVMSIFVIVFNRLFWRRLYKYAEKHTGFA